MEIYFLHKEKIRVSKATNIVLQNFIVYQTSLILVGIFALGYNYIYGIFPNNSLIKKLVVLGFMINLLILVLSFILSFGKKLNKFILNKGLDILSKIRIVKNKDKARDKLNIYLNNFYENAVKLKENKSKLIILIFVNIIGIVSLYSVSYVVIKGLGINNVSLVKSIVSTAYVMIIGSFVPIPGGTGGVEYGYIFFFGYLIKGSILNASMLVWRFITYYLGIVLGAILLFTYKRRDNK